MSRFEIVRTDAGWHARFRAANGRIVWWTENYTRRTTAYAAISGLATEFGYQWNPPTKDGHVDLDHWVHHAAGWGTQVREVDERTAP